MFETRSSAPEIFNLATGRGVSLRAILEELCRIAGVHPEVRVAPELTRANDPARIVGDASHLTDSVGWRPTTALDETLADVLAQHP
jgi:GDP-4-dehydro-6-deoxy-D-mannose reductase